MASAAAVIARTGRSSLAASSQPDPTDSSISTARAMTTSKAEALVYTLGSGCPERPAADVLDLLRRGERQGQHHQPGEQERTGVQQREPEPDGHAAPIR